MSTGEALRKAEEAVKMAREAHRLASEAEHKAERLGDAIAGLERLIRDRWAQDAVRLRELREALRNDHEDLAGRIGVVSEHVDDLRDRVDAKISELLTARVKLWLTVAGFLIALLLSANAWLLERGDFLHPRAPVLLGPADNPPPARRPGGGYP